MTSTTHRPESTATTLYAALELGSKEWWLTMSVTAAATRQRVRGPPGNPDGHPRDTATPQRVRVPPGNQDAIHRALTTAKARFGVTADAVVRSCYEAGRDGFWPHRLLTRLGVTNLVVDSSSIEVPRRARRAKTDRLDGEQLLRLLLRHWGGEREMWQVVHVPSRDVEDARHASRGLTTRQGDRAQWREQMPD